MRITLIGVLMCVAVSCRSMPRPSGGATSTKVSHVVICWLKNPGDAAARQRLIDASQEFRKIPGVIDVSAGVAIPSDRLVVDSSFDVAVIITFVDEKSLQDYETNPIHQAAKKDHLQPLVKKFVIYDVQEKVLPPMGHR